MTRSHEFSLRPRIDLLMEVGSRVTGVDAQSLAAGAWALLAPPLVDGAARGGFSELNNDGCPAQLCLTLAADGGTTRVIVDPAWEVRDRPLRLAAGRQALADALVAGSCGALGPLCETLLDALLPPDPAALVDYDSSFFWLGVGLDQPGCAIYVDVRPLGHAGWARTETWLTAILPDAGDAIACLERLRPHVVLSSVGLEGVSPARGRAKIYFRLRHAVPLSALGLPLLQDPLLAAFLATAIGDAELPLSGLVMSAGIDLATGALDDAKIDLCGHCLPGTAAHWASLVERLAAQVGVPGPGIGADLLASRCEVAFLGAGLDRRGRARLNVYLKPPGLGSAPAGARTLRERVARGCAYLGSLQRPDGSFTDFALPVGASTEWVTAFLGLAMAEAGMAADLPWAHAAAARAADWLVHARSYPAGWGFNGATGIDTDSTGFAIRLLRAAGHTVRPADRDALLQGWRPGGGFATYEGPANWGEVHPCVTAAAALALDDEERACRRADLLACIARTARDDGTWPAYWWRTHHYSTWHHLLLLRRLGVQAADGFGGGRPGARQPAPADAFALAHAAGIAFLREPGSTRAEGHLRDLLAAQRVDGGWTGGRNLRVTDPGCAEPWVSPSGELHRDGAGSITTASALIVLAEMLRG